MLGFPCECGRFLFHWISLPVHAGCSRTSDFPAYVCRRFPYLGFPCMCSRFPSFTPQCVPKFLNDELIVLQITSCPPGTQAVTLDIIHAYQCSLIAPAHKKYIALSWENSVYVQHNAVEGLAPTGGIQGMMADACIDILHPPSL